MPAPALPFIRALAMALAAVAAASPALAHHPMGGTTPATFMQGLLSGFGHPVIGLDHLAALIGVGLVSARFAQGLALPLAWVAAMAAGVGVHVAGIDLPYAEVLVALTVIAIGLAALRPVLSTGSVALLFAAGGLAHGHALAEAIVSAEPTPLAAYLVGLVAVQAAVTTGVALVARSLARGRTAPSPELRYAGAAVVAVGAIALVLPAFG